MVRGWRWQPARGRAREIEMYCDYQDPTGLGFSEAMVKRLEDAGYGWEEPVFVKPVRVIRRTARKRHIGRRRVGYSNFAFVWIEVGQRYSERTERHVGADGCSRHVVTRWAP
jgi:hypothetical protein